MLEALGGWGWRITDLRLFSEFLAQEKVKWQMAWLWWVGTVKRGFMISIPNQIHRRDIPSSVSGCPQFGRVLKLRQGGICSLGAFFLQTSLMMKTFFFWGNTLTNLTAHALLCNWRNVSLGTRSIFQLPLGYPGALCGFNSHRGSDEVTLGRPIRNCHR